MAHAPIFFANHLRAMDRGKESLRLELRRRRGTTGGSETTPPGPTFARLAKTLDG